MKAFKNHPTHGERKVGIVVARRFAVATFHAIAVKFIPELLIFGSTPGHNTLSHHERLVDYRDLRFCTLISGDRRKLSTSLSSWRSTQF